MPEQDVGIVQPFGPHGERRDQGTVIREIQRLFSERLAIRVDSAELDLLDTGILDSVSLVGLVLHLEQHFGVELRMEDLEIESFRSLLTIANVVSGRQRGSAAGNGSV